MDLEVKYRGRIATTEDIEFIHKLISENPHDSRRKLSQKLCEAWSWVQPNGALRDMVARGFMLELQRAGYIQLPPKKASPNNPFQNRKQPDPIEIEVSPFHTALNEVRPLEFHQVRRTDSEKLFNSLMNRYHYLGYCQPVGEHLKYIVYSKKRPLACLAWSSAPRHIGARDRFIGWDVEDRKKNLCLMAYNTRFLILPWVKVPHLASHILGRMARILSGDWEGMYHHPVYYLETFVDKERFKGTCYQAANWIYLGDTTGRGKNDQTRKPNRSIKAVLGYPLIKDFRKYLTRETK
ncbi:MAG: hypothetical protein C0403_18575 [Desulfobacterium sp.]|nr:hypothetical protein [Desulfobacterium sp.]